MGSGLAGLQTAWQLAGAGEVHLFTQSRAGAGNSSRAQGGIAAAVGEGDPDTVEVLVREGPAAVAGLARLGIPFDRSGDRWALGKEGSHSVSRILHASGDATGAAMVETLLARVRSHPRIRLFSHTRVTGLIAEGGECFGVTAVRGEEGIVCRARAVVLATGGCGQVFRYTTNDPVVTGGGLAMAYRAGAALADMEFVQFHPTALAVEQNPMFLISEAVRGEGAVLVNSCGEAFMGRYHDWKDLAPRDVVSRAIDREVREGRRVFLDARGLKERFAARFPTIFARCLEHGIDPRRDRIPVTPAAHFLMGGVRTDSHGRSGVRRLFAVGEVACTGVHGANRLASNSLLEGAVFASRVAKAAGRLPRVPAFPDRVVRQEMFTVDQENPVYADAVRRIMWEHAGIVRNRNSLIDGMNALSSLREEVPGEYLECHDMIDVSQVILHSALKREESRGGHFRGDFPEPREEWAKKRIRIRRGEPVEPIAIEKTGM
nr:L-aspartate oxidase [Melghirimyces profundicolus]